MWKSTSNADWIGTSVDAVKSYLKTTGPLVIFMSADDDWYGSQHGSARGYHAVVVTGFHDDVNVPGGGYWIVENSWGSGWNGNGYARIAYCQSAPWRQSRTCHYRFRLLRGRNGHGDMDRRRPATPATGTPHDWANGGSDYTWVNQDTQAHFGAGSNQAITISSTAIAHGLTFSAAGYSISSGSLTVTSGGIVAGESVTVNSALYVGGPQSWNVAAGKTLSVTGALHTIISDLTFSGAGNTTISNTIDGGGIINTVGGAKPGGLIQAGSGAVTLSGAANFAGDVTVRTAPVL